VLKFRRRGGRSLQNGILFNTSGNKLPSFSLFSHLTLNMVCGLSVCLWPFGTH